MYDIKQYIGKIVTIKTNSNQEYIGKLVGVFDDMSAITISHLKVVAVDNEAVVILPFALTADSSNVTLNTSDVLAVLPTLSETSDDYNKLFSDDVLYSEVELEDEDK